MFICRYLYVLKINKKIGLNTLLARFTFHDANVVCLSKQQIITSLRHFVPKYKVVDISPSVKSLAQNAKRTTTVIPKP